jgi:hypothetical protein
MKLHAKLPPKYRELMSQLKGQKILGIKITDSLVLEGLVKIAWDIAKQYSPKDAVLRIEGLVLANLASIWTFVFLEKEGGAYPYWSYIESERWYLGHFSDQIPRGENDDWKFIDSLHCGQKYRFSNINTLNTQLGARIGKCSTYTITLGLILYVCELVDDLSLVGANGHAWVHCKVKGDEEYRHIDLSLRSHGQLESDKGPNHYRDLMLSEDVVLFNFALHEKGA